MNKINSGILVLTSIGLSSVGVAKEVKKYFNKIDHKKVAIITTASRGKSRNKFVKLAVEQFKSFGFKIIDLIDLENYTSKGLSQYTVIYVAGGDVFKLLKYARKSKFKTIVQDLLARNGMYIGVSAGAMIMGSSIEIALFVDPEPNTVGLKDFRALELIAGEIHPHYIAAHNKDLTKYKKTTSHAVITLANAQALVVNRSGEKLIRS